VYKTQDWKWRALFQYEANQKETSVLLDHVVGNRFTALDHKPSSKSVKRCLTADDGEEM